VEQNGCSNRAILPPTTDRGFVRGAQSAAQTHAPSPLEYRLRVESILIISKLICHAHALRVMLGAYTRGPFGNSTHPIPGSRKSSAGSQKAG
jgi:hypothetical protein